MSLLRVSNVLTTSHAAPEPETELSFPGSNKQAIVIVSLRGFVASDCPIKSIKSEQLQLVALAADIFPFLKPGQVKTDKLSLEAYGRDWLKDWAPAPAAILFPESVEDVRKIVEAANTRRVALVPSGGRTGLSGGAAATNGEFVVALERLNKILALDRTGRTVALQAGVPTQTLKDYAEKHNLYFPLDVPSKGSCQIGGNIATNAGGIHVIKYGSTKDWILGLKVVTGAGEVLTLNNTLFKNNTGYDLKSLFVGSEGTLGIIVEASLKLTSPPGDIRRLLLAHDKKDGLLSLLELARDSLPSLCAFEYFSKDAMEIILKYRSLKNPFRKLYSDYTLIELEEAAPNELDADLEKFAEIVSARGLSEDMILSQGPTQSLELLKYRELISDTLSANFEIHKHDISVPVPDGIKFMADFERLMTKSLGGAKMVVFGHLGDGNLHLNWLKPEDMASSDFKSLSTKGADEIFKLVASFGGSVSAEHGVGLLKRDKLHYSKTKVEIEVMRQIKKMLDPNNIMNPGKIFEVTAP